MDRTIQRGRTPRTGAGRREASRLMVPFAVLAVLAVIAVGALAWHSARVEDRFAATTSDRLARANLTAEAADLGRLTKDYSWWDVAIERLFVAPDARWTDDNIGWYMNETFDVDAAIVIDVEGGTHTAFVDGKLTGRKAPEIVAHGLDRLVAEARAAPMNEPVPITGFATIDGRPAIIAANAYTPENPTPDELKPRIRPVLVLARALEEGYLARLSERTLLDDMRFDAVAGGLPPGRLAVEIEAIDGARLGWITWRAGQPGTDLITAVLPYAVIGVFTLGVLAALFVGRLQDIVGHVDAQSQELATRAAALAAGERRFRDFALAASDWFWETDSGHRFVFVSKTIDEVSSVNPAWMVGRSWPDLTAPGEEEGRRLWDAGVLAQHEPFRDIIARQFLPDGGMAYLKISGLPKLAPDGSFEGFRGTCSDITAEVEARRSSREAEARLNQSAKLATLGEMAAGIVHELNQPLNVIRVTADDTMMAIEAGVRDTEEVRDAIATVRAQTARMAGIIHNMRIFSRDDYGRREVFDVRTAVNDALGMMRSDLVKSGIRVETEISGKGHTVWGQQLRLEQVLLNLLSNAADQIRARAARGPARTPGQPAGHVTVAVDRAEGSDVVTIAVIDDGGGIASEHLARIFDPFFTTKAPGQGTGLGLSISYGIVASMGGELTARNVGEGARFEVALTAHGEVAKAGADAVTAGQG